MRLLYLHPVSDDRGGHTCLATIDVELSADVRLYGLRLMRMRDGKHLVFAPQSGQRRVATFSPAMAEQLTAMAVEALRVAA
jgi:hypothetical protein